MNKPQVKHDKIIWISGASSGIGKALCFNFQAKGWQVIASSRDEAQLLAIFEGLTNVTCIACDVSDETSVEQAGKRIADKFAGISHVIVNAGTCEYVDQVPMDVALFERLWKVNVAGVINTINAALPLLQTTSKASPTQAKFKGHLIVVSSQVVFAPFTQAEAYGATKAAVDYLMNSLRIDLAAEPIDISVVHPGFVDTPLTQKNTFPMPFLQTVDQACAHFNRVIQKRPKRSIFPKRLYALLRLSSLFPAFWVRLMARDCNVRINS